MHFFLTLSLLKQARIISFHSINSLIRSNRWLHEVRTPECGALMPPHLSSAFLISLPVWLPCAIQPGLSPCLTPTEPSLFSNLLTVFLPLLIFRFCPSFSACPKCHLFLEAVLPWPSHITAICPFHLKPSPPLMALATINCVKVIWDPKLLSCG